MLSDSTPQKAVFPSEANSLTMFDRMATRISGFVARAWFFGACVLVIVIWLPTFFLFNLDTWQLIINTFTTIVTFLLVALLQNTQARADRAIQQKLNALAAAVSSLVEANENVEEDVEELRAAVGVEYREGT